MYMRALLLPLVAGGMATCALAPIANAQQPVTAAVTAAAPAPAEARLIGVDEVRKRLDAGEKLLVIDARASLGGEVAKGAIHVPVSDVDAWAKDVPKDAFIVAYCACPTDGGSKAVVSRLTALGFTNAYALHGGIGAWTAAGLPTERPGGGA